MDLSYGRTFSFVLAVVALSLGAGSARAGVADRSQELLARNLVDGPLGFGDSGIDYPTYPSIEQDLKSLAQRYPGLAQVVQYGVTPKGNFLNILRIANVRAPRRGIGP